jgi:HEAT repeat protein
MPTVFDNLLKVSAAGLVLKAIFAAVLADAVLLAFILTRRAYRKRYFRKRDARVFQLRQRWPDLISGRIPYEKWRGNNFDRRIVETMALDSLEAANTEEAARLLRFLRSSGLIEKRIYEARRFTGWRRLRALVALGRTRAPEGIPALSEALRDKDLESRLAALRGLARTASPQAGEEILAWVGEQGLTVPALPLQTALLQCCAERPHMLLPYVQNAQGPLRETLGRVLGEVATPSLGLDLLQFVSDDLDELRAAAARALAQSPSSMSLDVLDELTRDRTWFVRLRAIVSLGLLSDRRATPALLRGLTDSNRLVRFRAAEGLVGLKTEMVPVFQKVAATRDRYALHAYVTALENANAFAKLESDLRSCDFLASEEKERLQNALHSGLLAAEAPTAAPEFSKVAVAT